MTASGNLAEDGLRGRIVRSVDGSSAVTTRITFRLGCHHMELLGVHRRRTGRYWHSQGLHQLCLS